MSTSNVRVGVWVLKDIYEKINAGFLTYGGDDPVPLQTYEMWAAGLTNSGQLANNLGDGDLRTSPIQIPGTNWTQVIGSNTGGSIFALKCDNTLWAWGESYNGRLGDNQATSDRSSPIQIPGTSWCRIAAADCFGHAIKTDGTLWGWGKNVCGNVGVNNTTLYSSPVQIPGTAWCFSSDGQNTHALKTDGTLWSWGWNYAGSLGIGTGNINCCVSSPIQVPGTNWIDVRGAGLRGIARKSDGTLWSWGYNPKGSMGDGTIIPKSSPVQIPGTSWNQIAGGQTHTAATKTDGTLWLWGCSGNYGWGQIGEGVRVDRSSPVQIPGTQWRCLWNGSLNQNSHATKTDGTLYVWGLNPYGNLGTGNQTPSSSPVQIPGTKWFCSTGTGNDTSYFLKCP